MGSWPTTISDFFEIVFVDGDPLAGICADHFKSIRKTNTLKNTRCFKILVDVDDEDDDDDWSLIGIET